MKFILEGTDGSGKSTLAKEIQNTFKYMDFKIIHCTRETPNNMLYFSEMINSSENLIIDRGWIGQFVYQTAEERERNNWLNYIDLEYIECLSSRLGVIKLYVNTPTDVCLYNCLHNGEDGHYTEEYIDELKLTYENLLFKSNHCFGWEKYNNNFVSPEVARNFDYSSLPHIVCVDFDGTLNMTNDPFPSIGSPNIELINDLKNGRWKDSKKILYTARTGFSLDEAIECCRNWGLEFDAINDNIKEVKEVGLNPRKVYCNLFIDDTALNPCDVYFD